MLGKDERAVGAAKAKTIAHSSIDFLLLCLFGNKIECWAYVGLVQVSRRR